MCGICGIARRDQASVRPSLLEGMNAAISHRGPDGEGYTYHPGVGLAMRRLAIIDLNTGDQPICNEDETIWIVFNGEIYNFPELRAGLEARGHTFRTRTDTECILHLYEEHGPGCVDYLRGMFAFAIWDGQEQQLLVARDRLGQKPLYYSRQGDGFYFSSELHSLLTALPDQPAINFQAVDSYLSLQYIPEPFTAFEGVYKLLPAHLLIWQQGRITTRRYWQLDYRTRLDGSESQLAEELRERVFEAVKIRMISDVPLGAHLSGGIDSSIVVAMMAQASSLPVKTFTINFEEAGFSEAAYARSVAERYGTDHHEFTLTFEDIPGTMETVIRHVGEPFADPSALPSYFLSKMTRQYVTVALNGDGGDEAFAGYQRYWLDPWANRYLALPAFLTGNLLPALVRCLPDRSDRPVGQDLLNGLKRLRQLAATDRRASILRWGSYFSAAQKSCLWKPEYLEALDLRAAENLLIETFRGAAAHGDLNRTLYTDIHTYLPGDLLVKADRMSMANSLEGRSPFLDHELMAWAAGLPETLRIRGGKGKYLLRKAFRDALPERVQGRGKQGFGVPVSTWFRGPLAGWSREVIHENLADWFAAGALERIFEEHQSGKLDHGKRLWALVALGLWKGQLKETT
ncbi:MAG: asparagine synthase (glutamine-hydrolyzing) [Anaerolineales bacterium]|nr:asparagine synthase (glutamine-hydrolyzing) [Anaerolineales bacterium]